MPRRRSRSEIVRRSGSGNNSSGTSEAVVVDLGRYRPVRIRQLRRGRGRIMEAMMDTHEEIQRERSGAESSSKVIYIVERQQSEGRRRRRRRRR